MLRQALILLVCIGLVEARRGASRVSTSGSFILSSSNRAGNDELSELDQADLGGGGHLELESKHRQDSLGDALHYKSNVLQTNAGTGGWGGSCTCPDGQVYQVGDNGNSCGSLACIGGTPGPCKRHRGPWSGNKVTCGSTGQGCKAYSLSVNTTNGRLKTCDTGSLPCYDKQIKPGPEAWRHGRYREMLNGADVSVATVVGDCHICPVGFDFPAMPSSDHLICMNSQWDSAKGPASQLFFFPETPVAMMTAPKRIGLTNRLMVFKPAFDAGGYRFYFETVCHVVKATVCEPAEEGSVCASQKELSLHSIQWINLNNFKGSATDRTKHITVGFNDDKKFQRSSSIADEIINSIKEQIPDFDTVLKNFDHIIAPAVTKFDQDLGICSPQAQQA